MMLLALSLANFNVDEYETDDLLFSAFHALLVNARVKWGSVNDGENFKPPVRFLHDLGILYMAWPDSVDEYEEDRRRYGDKLIAWPDGEGFRESLDSLTRQARKKIMPWLDELADTGAISPARINAYDATSVSSHGGYNRTPENWERCAEVYRLVPDLGNYAIDRDFILPIRADASHRFPEIRRVKNDGRTLYELR